MQVMVPDASNQSNTFRTQALSDDNTTHHTSSEGTHPDNKSIPAPARKNSAPDYPPAHGKAPRPVTVAAPPRQDAQPASLDGSSSNSKNTSNSCGRLSQLELLRAHLMLGSPQYSTRHAPQYSTGYAPHAASVKPSAPPTSQKASETVTILGLSGSLKRGNKHTHALDQKRAASPCKKMPRCEMPQLRQCTAPSNESAAVRSAEVDVDADWKWMQWQQRQHSPPNLV